MRRYALGMVLATAHLHRLYSTGGTDHLHLVNAAPAWASALLIVATIGFVGLVIAGVWVVARAARRMSRPGKIAVGLVGLWTTVFAMVAFLDAYRPNGDWRGGVVEASFAVLYGLVGSGIVWALDKAAKRLRPSSPV